MSINKYIQEAVSRKATDIHIHSQKVYYRIQKDLVDSKNIVPNNFSTEVTKQGTVTDLPTYVEKRNDLHYRILPQKYSLESLQYPLEIKSIMNRRRGLIIVSGSPGSGKTTILTHLMHSVSLKKVFINNVYLPKFETSSIYSSTTSDQDISLVEINNADDAFKALRSSAGHLVIAQMNTNGITDTLRHFLFLLNQYDKHLVLDLLAEHLQVLLSTKILFSKERKVLPLIGILQNNQSSKRRIINGAFNEIDDLINNENAGAGSLSIDGQLAIWLQQRVISMDEALRVAINPSTMNLRAAGIIHNE
jgi:twitching motility protein PilT